MLHDEQVMTFGEAARSLPRFNEKHVSPCTIWRWARKGVRGVKLETRLLGGRFVTSREALDRFSKTLAETAVPARTPAPSTAPATRTQKQRERAIQRAEKHFSQVG